jgi:Ca-activated chloride channel family protein
MRKHPLTVALLASCLLVLLCAGVVLANLLDAAQAKPGMVSAREDGVSLHAGLTQRMVHSGSGSSVGLALTLACDPEPLREEPAPRNVDLVVVLDRSGSMAGRKLEDARTAVLELLSHLGPGDRFALVSYASDVTVHTSLSPVNAQTRPGLSATAMSLHAGGGTNLGGGLAAGMRILDDARRMEAGSDAPRDRVCKLILISDGHANEGVTDARALGQMAALSFGGDFTVTTVGVGVDYNENLMGTIADFGGGNYHFLESPSRFAQLFLEELAQTRAVAAHGLELRLPLPEGVALLDAAGYPVAMRDGAAVIRPGSLRSGQERTIFLTLGVSPGDERSFDLSGIELAYELRGGPGLVRLGGALELARVADAKLALASVNPELWEKKTLQEDYNRLRESVSADVARGDADAARAKIDVYRKEKQAMNAQVRSVAVEENITSGLGELERTVEHAAEGTDELRKRASKAMQAESYAMRRAKAAP